jgi:hypothetical protein
VAASSPTGALGVVLVLGVSLTYHSVSLANYTERPVRGTLNFATFPPMFSS